MGNTFVKAPPEKPGSQETRIAAAKRLFDEIGTNYPTNMAAVEDLSPFFAKLGPEAFNVLVLKVAARLRENTYRYLRTLKLLLRTGAIDSEDDVAIFDKLVFPGTGTHRAMDAAMLDVLEPVFRNVLPELRQRGFVSTAADFADSAAPTLCRKLVYFGGYNINFHIFAKVFFALLERNPSSAQALARLVDLVNGRLEFNGFSVAAFYKDLTWKNSRLIKAAAKTGRPFDLLRAANAILKQLRSKNQTVYPAPELLERCLTGGWLSREEISAIPETAPEVFAKAKLYSRARRIIDYRYVDLSPQLTYQSFPHRFKASMTPVEILDEFKEIMVWTSLETLRVERFLRLLQGSSDRNVLVLANLRLGRMYIEPLKRSCRDLDNLTFVDARIGSTEFTNRIYVTVNPLDRQTTLRILEEQPHVVVVDASIQGRFPYAFKGYTNFFAAVNEVLTGSPGFPNFRYACHCPAIEPLDNEANYRAEPSFQVTRTKLQKMCAMNRVGPKKDHYRLHLLSHPSLRDVVLRAGFDNTEPKIMNRDTNCTDIITNDYLPNLVNDSFFSNTDRTGTPRGKRPGAFLINAFFPFDQFYRGREDERLDGIGASLREIGIGHSLNNVSNIEDRQGRVSFDDLCEVLLETTRGITKAIHIDLETGTVKLVNDDLIHRVTETYLEFKAKYNLA